MEKESGVTEDKKGRIGGYDCAKCGRRIRVHAPEHNGATGYFYCKKCDSDDREIKRG